MLDMSLLVKAGLGGGASKAEMGTLTLLCVAVGVAGVGTVL